MRLSRALLAGMVTVLWIASDPAPALPQVPDPSAAARPVPAGRSPVLVQAGSERRITLALDGVALAVALDSIATLGGIRVSYAESVTRRAGPVTLHVREVTAWEALTAALEGTGLEAVRGAGGGTILVRPAPAGVSTGTIDGIVTDSATGDPLQGATVTAIGTSRGATTNERGRYRLTEVPVGELQVAVRLIGYEPATRRVTISEGELITVDFALRGAITRLQEVVTTATGERRRYELGNSITTINVDSVMQLQPVGSLAQLLEARVPGLVVTHTSGNPGDPTRLRLRGTSSVTRGNDPIVIVDGIRVYAEQSEGRAANLAVLESDGRPIPTGDEEQIAAPSPLEQLDPNSIQKVEIFKGPSAATLYGADAANGVIVVTTKRGVAGPPRWTFSASYGPSYMPGKYPTAYFRYGFLPTFGRNTRCPLAAYGCIVDSVVPYQALNDPALTVLGRGHRETVSAGVSGGSEALTYSLTASFANELGLLKLPDLEARRYEARRGSPAPNWMLRPQGMEEWAGTGRVTFQVGSKADVAFTSSVSRSDQRRSSLDQQITRMMGVYADTVNDRYYTGAQHGPPGSFEFPDGVLVQGFSTRTTAQATSFTEAVQLNWRPLGWLTATADLGINIVNRHDQSTQAKPQPEDPEDPEVQVEDGYFNTGSGNSVVTTLNLGAATVLPLLRDLRLRTAFGGNFTRTRSTDLIAAGQGLAPGATGLAGAREIITSERLSRVTTFGWYVEPTLEHKRFFLSTGLRLDGADTYGSNQSLAGFPKVSLSYLLSDEPFFPLKRVFSTVRLRAAYGQAGVQPGPVDRLRLYRPSNGFFDGETVDASQLTNVGNVNLKPERSEEFEAGLDVDLFGQAATLELTAYRKIRMNALIPLTLPHSVNGGGTVIVNIGKVRNAGFEIGLGTNFFRGDVIRFGTQVHLARNRNLVLSMGEMDRIVGLGGTRVVAGYPLFGVWTKPILHFADADHDGIITPTEVRLGDDEVFLGPIEPDYEAGLHANLSAFKGLITANASFSYTDGQNRVNGVALTNQFIVPAANLPGSPLAEQAALIAANMGSTYGLAQQVSTLRFNSFSVGLNLPPDRAQQLFGARTVSFTLQGTNLGLWSNYRGKDPSVNVYTTGNVIGDTGQLPLPRTWAAGIRLGY